MNNSKQKKKKYQKHTFKFAEMISTYRLCPTGQFKVLRDFMKAQERVIKNEATYCK